MIKTSDDKILILISHYLPGYKIGGPLNSVLSITKNLEDYYNFFIITSDRDMGDEKSYINIEKNKWLKTDSAVAMYFSPGISYYWNIYKHLRKNSYNIVYLNSLFEWKFSIFIILLNYFRLFKTNKIIVAPRGELFDEAIKFGKFKKQAFLRIANFLGLYNRVIWHSTAEIETLTINNNIPNPEIRLARTLSNTTCTLFEIKEPEFSLKQGVSLKVIFLSRISKEKNLIYALRVLKEVSCFVEFHIYQLYRVPRWAQRRPG